MLKWTNETGQTLTAGGKQLEYACWGPKPGKAPTIVMLHEGLGSVAMWRDVPQRLADATGFGVLAYSRAGYGQSDGISLPRPLDYQTREAQDVLGDVLDAVGSEHVILLGHSDGATIAAIYGGSVSDLRVRGLILIAPHFFTEPTGIEAIKAAGKAFREGDLRSKLAKYHADVDMAFNGWHDVWVNPDYAAKWNVADAIDHLRIPVLAMQGRDDAYGTLAQVEEIESRIYSPVDTSILDDCGHDPFRDQLQKAVDAIAEFCARLDRIERVEVSLG